MMSWQYWIFLLAAIVPSSMWVIGQYMEGKLQKKGFQEYEEVEQPLSEQFLVLFNQLASTAALVCVPLGLFGNQVFFAIGIVSFLFELWSLGKLGVYDTMLKG